MIEPQSAQEGASAWEVNVTWPRPMPRLLRVLRVPALLPFPLPLVGAAEAEGPSLAGGVEGATSLGAATAVVESTPAALTLLGGEAGAAVPDGPLPKLPAPPVAPAGLPNPRFRGWTEDSAVTDRSTRPRVARSSAGRKRELSQRKM